MSCQRPAFNEVNEWALIIANPIGNANNFETMEECILNCSGPDNQGEEESNEDIFISPLDSFSSRLSRLKTKFNNRNRGSLKTESPIQGKKMFLKKLKKYFYHSSE